MLYIPAGEVIIGEESDQTLVDLDDFWIHKYEVTHQQYVLCVQAGVCKSAGSEYQYNFPVNFVDWYQAKEYCEWSGGRLPTSDEWEKAARGTDDRIYPWGDEEPNCLYSNFLGCSTGPEIVGSHPAGASIYGGLDMVGNLDEWVDDPDYENDSYKAFRGGSWDDSSYYLRISRVGYALNKHSDASVGFRCVYDDPPEEKNR